MTSVHSSFLACRRMTGIRCRQVELKGNFWTGPSRGRVLCACLACLEDLDACWSLVYQVVHQKAV